MTRTKPILATIAATLFAVPAFAGTLEEPVIESDPVVPATVVEDASSSAGQDWVIPLLILALLAAVAAD